MVTDDLDKLRGRFVRLRAARPLERVAVEMGLSFPTLRRFLHGCSVRTATLERIELWCLWRETVAARASEERMGE